MHPLLIAALCVLAAVLLLAFLTALITYFKVFYVKRRKFVEGGEVYMSYSDCPDHVCENTGRVRYVGQTIICLPNHLAITIIGEADDAVDFVS